MQISKICASLMLTAGFFFVTSSQGLASTLAEPMDDTAYSLALQEVLAASAPIEGYVAPPSVFPSEGYWGTSREVVKEPYQPIDAYDSVGGRLIGHVVVAKPQCLVEGERPVGCNGAGQVFVSLQDGRQRVVPVEMWNEGTLGLVTRKPSVVSGARTWSEIAYTGGTFWVQTAPADIHLYEEQAAYVENLETWCTAPGKCAPASPTMLAALKAADGHFVNPNGSPYQVEERVILKGKAYYRVKLSEIEGGWPKLGLPLTGFVPARTKDGKHTGTFLPMGC